MQARQRRDMEEVEDVRSVYFTVHMSTKGMLDYLVCGPVEELHANPLFL